MVAPPCCCPTVLRVSNWIADGIDLTRIRLELRPRQAERVVRLGLIERIADQR